jgi:SpoVK/Ycf46/Vps4 family AAA+-type ATPase
MKKLMEKANEGPYKVFLIITLDLSPVPMLRELVTSRALSQHDSPDLKIFQLPDYTDEELHKILIGILQKGDAKVEVEGGLEGPHLRTLVSIIGRSRETLSFKNASALHECLAKIRKRQRERIRRQRHDDDCEQEPRPHFFTKADILGETAEERRSRNQAWKQLDAMIGLDGIKQAVRDLFAQACVNDYRDLQGRRPLHIELNRLFLGPPGTGKTTVARIIGKILADLGLVEDARVVVKAASDLIGPYVGQTEERTTAALEETRGCLLIIDDAHMLVPGAMHNMHYSTDEYRAALIDTLVVNLQPDTGERRAIFMIGYPSAMYELIETSNPGLSRRFPLEEAFHFPPFDKIQLGHILEFKLRRDDLDATPEALEVARYMLSIAQNRPNFGNGGHVENMLNHAKSSYQARVSRMDAFKGSQQQLEPQDFDADHKRHAEASARCAVLFSDMQGVGYIMNQFQGYQNMVTQLRKRRHDPRPFIPLTFVFKGPPGTGKTTVARLMAQIYYDMGFLAAPELIECSISNLVSGYAGQTGQNVIRMFERALGKVLFIDEAYRLGEMRALDAIGEMVDCMTKERFARKLVIVLAGYSEDMDRLMHMNRGLRSRFTTDIVFRPMSPSDAISLLRKRLAELNIRISGLEPLDASYGPVVRILAKLAKTKSWANGRDVEALSRDVVQHAFSHKLADIVSQESIVIEAKELLPILATRVAKAFEEDKQMDGS